MDIKQLYEECMEIEKYRDSYEMDSESTVEWMVKAMHFLERRKFFEVRHVTMLKGDIATKWLEGRGESAYIGVINSLKTIKNSASKISSSSVEFETKIPYNLHNDTNRFPSRYVVRVGQRTRFVEGRLVYVDLSLKTIGNRTWEHWDRDFIINANVSANLTDNTVDAMVDLISYPPIIFGTGIPDAMFSIIEEVVTKMGAGSINVLTELHPAARMIVEGRDGYTKVSPEDYSGYSYWHTKNLKEERGS